MTRHRDPRSRLDLTRLLAPRSVVVVGATDRPGSYAAATLLNLRRAGFPGPVVGLHPRRTEVLGIRCFPILDDVSAHLGAAPDAVVIATPADTVTGYLQDAGRLGAGGAVVYAAGFGESGNHTGQYEIVTAAAQHYLPVLGPNGNGFVTVGARAPLWGDAVTLPPDTGPIALITQSGNLGVLALAHRQGLGLHTVVSLGNAAVIDAPAVLSHLATTAGVRAIALYLEDDGDGTRLATALAACARNDVRVAVLKTGRSTAGRQTTQAHTAALAGDHRVFAALIHEAGGVLTHDPHELLETTRALATGRAPASGRSLATRPGLATGHTPATDHSVATGHGPATGHGLVVGRGRPGKLAVLTASGGDAAIAADLAADAGIPLADLSPATRTRLAELLPPTATVTNPLDHTNLVWADTEAIAQLTATLATDPDVGPVLYVQDEPPGLPPADAAEWAATRAGVALGAARSGRPVLLVATMPGQEPPWPSPGAVCGLRSALAATAALRRPPADPARLDAIAAAARAIPVRSRAATSSISGWLAEHEAKAVLAEHVPIPRHRTVALGEIDAAVTAAREVGYPVALKLSARGLLHKSETGALALNLRTDHEVRAAAVRLLQITGRPDQLPDGPPRIEDHATPPDTTAPEPAVLLVEQMAEPGLELLIAARRDGLVPALTIGLGGIWAETVDDVVVIPLPVEPDQVLTAVHTLRAAPLLTGGRGCPPVDLTALATIAARIGDLLLTGRFSLIEVNPLILGPDSAVAVDALVRY